MELDFSKRIMFYQNFRESAKNWPKIMFFMFFSKSCLYLFCLNWSSYILYTILSNCISGKNLVLKLWPKIVLFNQIFQKWISQDWLDGLSWFFFYGVKSFRGIQWMLNDFIFLRVRARACIFSPRIYLPFLLNFNRCI